jgi:hypothetical protein
MLRKESRCENLISISSLESRNGIKEQQGSIKAKKETVMVAVPIPRSGASSQARYPQAFASHSGAPAAGSASFPAPAQQAKSPDWTSFLIAGTLVAGGALMVSGRRRAGLAVAAAGTALALVEEQETVKQWWKNLPGYLSDAQQFLDKVEGYLEEATIQGQRLQGILRR